MIREVLTFNDNREFLTTPCRDVTTDDDVTNIVGDLLETAESQGDNCAGLAANQIGHQVNAFVAKIDGKFKVFINVVNPDKLLLVDGRAQDWEGCLSLPESKPMMVKRGNAIIIEYLTIPDSDGKSLTYEGLIGERKKYTKRQGSRCIQHEIDHVCGKVI